MDPTVVHAGNVCTATTKNGKPCCAPPQTGKPFCVHHDPAFDATRAKARRLGGKARQATHDRPPATPHKLPWWQLESVADAARGMAYVAQQVLLNRLEARSANAAVLALNALVGAIKIRDEAARVADVSSAACGPQVYVPQLDEAPEEQTT